MLNLLYYTILLPTCSAWTQIRYEFISSIVSIYKVLQKQAHGFNT